MSVDAEKCWAAVARRDGSQDGEFLYGVMTTGVYCRPSCPGRPLRKNVRFYADPQGAQRDGLRPCKRCKPDAEDPQPHARRIREICRYMESGGDDGPVNLAHLARRAGLSPYHFLRTFTAIVGVTPKKYVEALRLGKLKSGLKRQTVTGAAFDAGFESLSGIYRGAGTQLGMTPRQYRGGGEGVSISYAAVDSMLGRMMIGATDRGICFVQFGESDSALAGALQREYPRARVEPMQKPEHPEFTKWIAALTRHLEGRQSHVDLPLDIRATAFQMRVWTYLRSIPYGKVQPYAEVAAGIGNPRAIRAVARACAANTVAILIPCHRVIRGSGELAGYRWGLERKRMLIDRERAVRSRSAKA